MKNLNLLAIYFFLTVSSVGFGQALNSQRALDIKNDFQSKLSGGTSGVGGGGDEVGLEFQQAFITAIDKIKKNSPELARIVEKENLERISKNFEVIVVENSLKVPFKGLTQNSVAYNDRKLGVILINRLRWEKIKQIEHKEAIALHEVASLAGVERTGYYPISAQYASLTGVSPSTFTSLVDVDKTRKSSIGENTNVCRILADSGNIAVFIGKKRITPYGINYEYYVGELNKFRSSGMCTVAKERCQMSALGDDWYVLVNSQGQKISEQASNTDYLINILSLYRSAGLCQ